MSCCHSYEYSGYRTYSSHVPGYAQGAYFPGDEPGTKCKISGELCTDENGEHPEDCALQDDWDHLCPYCLAMKGNEVLLKISGNKILFCPECFHQYEDIDEIITEHEEYIFDIYSEMQKLKRELDKTKYKLEEAKDAAKKAAASIGIITDIFENKE